jgi:hypothetical protein
MAAARRLRNGEKMSKSLGNYFTVHELLEEGYRGEAIRLALLAAHYRQPVDFTRAGLAEASGQLDRFYLALERVIDIEAAPGEPPAGLLGLLKQRPSDWWPEDWPRSGRDRKPDRPAHRRPQSQGLRHRRPHPRRAGGRGGGAGGWPEGNELAAPGLEAVDEPWPPSELRSICFSIVIPGKAGIQGPRARC